MAAAGVLVNVYDPRTIWIAAAGLYLVGALVALVITSWLPVARADEWHAVEASSESAVAALDSGQYAPESEPVANGAPAPPLERLATLLEEIEARRAAEARRPS
jgi:hypothetical protein